MTDLNRVDVQRTFEVQVHDSLQVVTQVMRAVRKVLNLFALIG